MERRESFAGGTHVAAAGVTGKLQSAIADRGAAMVVPFPAPPSGAALDASAPREALAEHGRPGGSLWRGLAFALVIEGIAVWAVLASDGWMILPALLLSAMLLLIAAGDANEGRFSGRLGLLLVAAGLGTAYAVAPDLFFSHLAGAAGGFVAATAVGAVRHRFGPRQGRSLDTALLGAAVGAWVGWHGLLSVALLALGTALVARAVQGRAHPDADRPRLPLAASLAVGGWLVWLHGPLSFL